MNFLTAPIIIIGLVVLYILNSIKVPGNTRGA